MKKLMDIIEAIDFLTEKFFMIVTPIIGLIGVVLALCMAFKLYRMH